ncbi:PCC domain-containing protein [uncultured Methanospirillum sp.]|uniref:PPC domain-containing DNA-binding protein n=1 Tax=uncultured Methanospirillum sp. TaxID=262503 RepID=UPI0029C7FB9B|nr:DUF296 domain-containing protein [uncultured Methanospirillum sp.]
MQYASGSQGRIFYIRFDHGEDLLSGLHTFIREHRIGSGMIHLIGALSQGNIVTGPKETTLPPDPVWQSLDEAHELIGIAMIRQGPDGPSLHLHTSAGRGSSALTGCLRTGTQVYIVIEAVITEFSGFTITTGHDEKTGLDLPIPSQNLPE